MQEVWKAKDKMSDFKALGLVKSSDRYEKSSTEDRSQN